MRNKNKQKKAKWYIVLSIFLFLTGLGLLLYPSFTAWQYQNIVEKQRDEFRRQIKEEEAALMEVGDSKEEDRPFEELYQELKRRNEKLYQERQKSLANPWDYEQPELDLLKEYGLEGGVIGFLTIPKMEIELPILLGANKKNMSEGAVHLTQTSYPIGGENTSCVLAAHRGYRKAPMFRDIEMLVPGDEIYIENFRETLAYRVLYHQVIEPTDMDKLLIQEGRDLVILVTCHPYRVSTHRYVVFCERII